MSEEAIDYEGICGICGLPVDPDGSEGRDGKIVPALIHMPVSDSDDDVEASLEADNDHTPTVATCHWKDYFPGDECWGDISYMDDPRDGAPYCENHEMMRAEMLDAWELIHGFDPDKGAGWLPVCATCGFTVSEVGGGHVDAGAAAYCADLRGDEPIIAIFPEGTNL